MEERNDNGEKLDEVVLPGFRFHPTDEELVGFYLKRKIQQRPLSIELIKQLDIYKYDPWDLPSKRTHTGFKLLYPFYFMQVSNKVFIFYMVVMCRVGDHWGERVVFLLPQRQKVQEQCKA